MNEIYRPEVYISESEIRLRVEEIGQQITRDYSNRELVVVCVLKGAFIFCADLVKNIKIPLQMEYIMVSSYGEGTESSGHVRMLLDVGQSLEGKHVIIVEDIVDSGLTAEYLRRNLQDRKPSSLKFCSLLLKPARLVRPVTIDYLGMEIEDKFVVGYGMDYAGRFRELPYIGILETDH